MVKRRKNNRRPDKKDAAGSGDETREPSKVKTGSFCLKSSLGVPFLVVSDCDLVSGLPKPSSDEWQELLEISQRVVKQWDTRGGSVILADFEGEHTGLEGELLCAAFQRTWAVSPKGLKQMPCKNASREMGLLVDLRSADGVALVRRIMESESCSKMIWGADGDVASLHFSPVRSPLAISSSQVIDAQLAFSSQKQRLSMSNMLKRLPVETISRLPDKGSIDFTTPHAFNRRALHTPLSLSEATYAIDDLHRLDLVLINEKPQGGSYLTAESQTSAMVSLILHNTPGASTTKLRQYEGMLNRKADLERQSIAVRIKRHLIALRRHGFEACAKEFVALEEEVDHILRDVGVSIPDDLSFFSDLVAKNDGEVDGTCSRSASARKRKKKKRTNSLSDAGNGQAFLDEDNDTKPDNGNKLRNGKRKRGALDADPVPKRKLKKRRKQTPIVEAARSE